MNWLKESIVSGIRSEIANLLLTGLKDQCLLSVIWWFVYARNSINAFICGNTFKNDKYESMICLTNLALSKHHLIFIYNTLLKYREPRVIDISGSLIWSKTLIELIFNPCGEFRWSPEDPVSQTHSPHLLVDAPGIFSDLLRFVQMLKREWGAESNGKLPHQFIPGKTAT